jgi:hypothetical protein
MCENRKFKHKLTMPEQELTQQAQQVLNFYNVHGSLPKYFLRSQEKCARLRTGFEEYLKTVPKSERNELAINSHILMFQACALSEGLGEQHEPIIYDIQRCISENKNVGYCTNEIKRLANLGERVLSDVVNVEKDYVQQVKEARKECAESRSKYNVCTQFLRAKTDEQYKIEQSHWDQCNAYGEEFRKCVARKFCPVALKNYTTNDTEQTRKELEACWQPHRAAMEMLNVKE